MSNHPITTEFRSLYLRNIRRFLPELSEKAELSEKELRLVAAFIRGLRKGGKCHG